MTPAAMNTPIPDGVWEWFNNALIMPLGHKISWWCWSTQTALQAIGTGVLVDHFAWGVYYHHAGNPGWSTWTSQDRAKQSARIGFGAL